MYQCALFSVVVLGILLQIGAKRTEVAHLAPVGWSALDGSARSRAIRFKCKLVLAVLAPVDVDGGDLGFRVIQAPECLRREARAHNCSGSKEESECLRTWLG